MAAIHSLAALWPPAFARIWLCESCLLWRFILHAIFSANSIKAGYLSGRIMGRDLSSAVKLKVKPAVAEIELHWVSNVKSKGSLTVIKRPSTAFSSRHTVLKLYFTSWIVELLSSQPTTVSLLSQRHPLLEALTNVWKMGWNSEMLLCTKVLTQHGAPEDSLAMCVCICILLATSVCRHGSLWNCNGMCSVTGAEVRWVEDYFNMCPGTWNASLCTLLGFPPGLTLILLSQKVTQTARLALTDLWNRLKTRLYLDSVHFRNIHYIFFTAQVPSSFSDFAYKTYDWLRITPSKRM